MQPEQQKSRLNQRTEQHSLDSTTQFAFRFNQHFFPQFEPKAPNSALQTTIGSLCNGKSQIRAKNTETETQKKTAKKCNQNNRDRNPTNEDATHAIHYEMQLGYNTICDSRYPTFSFRIPNQNRQNLRCETQSDNAAAENRNFDQNPHRENVEKGTKPVTRTTKLETQPTKLDRLVQVLRV